MGIVADALRRCRGDDRDMRLTYHRFPVAALAALALLALAVPAGAVAAPTAGLSNGTLSVVGDATAETFTIVQTSSHVLVLGPKANNDPDGAGFSCAAPDDSFTASCLDSAVDRVVVNGAEGGDTLTDQRLSTPDHQELNGGPGDDMLIAAVGAADTVVLNAGSGDDVLVRNRPQTSQLTLLGDAGNDRLEAGQAGTLGQNDHGDSGNDTFVGSAEGANFFAAEPGADTYVGGTLTRGQSDLDVASDEVSYESSAVPVTVTLDGVANDGAAGEGDNVMPDIEIVAGGAAADQLTAGRHPATLYGRSGDDRLTGGGAHDELHGDAGSDVLLGGGGNDNLYDGDFTPDVQDQMQGPAGDDVLDGGPGDDQLASDRGADVLNGGGGFDDAEFFRVISRPPAAPPPSLPAPFEISLDGVANDGQRGTGEGDNVHGDIERLSTGDGDDVVAGSPGPDTIYTNGGDDRIQPAGGADFISSGDGDDAVRAVDRTTDRLECSNGHDSADVDLPGAQPERADVTFDCEAITGVPYGPPGASADLTAPRISRLRMTHRRFAAGRRNTARTATSRGTAFLFRLSEDARVTIAIRRGKRTVATLVRAHGRFGRNRVGFTGRVRGRALRRGRYRASIRAVDAAGNRSASRSVAFRVVRA